MKGVFVKYISLSDIIIEFRRRYKRLQEADLLGPRNPVLKKMNTQELNNLMDGEEVLVASTWYLKDTNS